MPVVIAIAGVPGSGKSTACRALARSLGDACVVTMDHYEQMTQRSMEEIAAWAARGAEFDELPVPLLDEHLGALRSGRAVTDPATGATIRPAHYIVFETQFGRAHRATGRHIDLLAWLDTPRDIALARTLRRLLADAVRAAPAEQGERLQWLQGYVENYLGLVQRLVVQQRERVRPGADLVVDGGAAPQSVVEQLLTQVRRRFEGVA